MLWSFPNSQINFCWQSELSKPRDVKRRSNLERSGSVFQSFICFWSSILLFFRLGIFLFLNSVLKPIEGKRKDTGTPISRSAKIKIQKAIDIKVEGYRSEQIEFIAIYILSLKMDLSVFCIT